MKPCHPSTALLAPLALVPAYAEHLKIPDECPDISSTEGDSIVGGGRGGGNGGTVIASRQLLRGQPSKAQHSPEAMLAVIVSFTFVGAAVVAFVSGGNVGGGGKNDDMEEMNAYTTISLKKSNGDDDRKKESWQRGRGRR
jgi:hypothetical protein